MNIDIISEFNKTIQLERHILSRELTKSLYVQLENLLVIGVKRDKIKDALTNLHAKYRGYPIERDALVEILDFLDKPT